MLRARARLGETAARALEDDGWLRESVGGQSPFPAFIANSYSAPPVPLLPRALSNRLTSIWLSCPNLSAKTLKKYRGMTSYNPGNIHIHRLSLTVSTHNAHHNPGNTSRFKTLPSTNNYNSTPRPTIQFLQIFIRHRLSDSSAQTA